MNCFVLCVNRVMSAGGTFEERWLAFLMAEGIGRLNIEEEEAMERATANLLGPRMALIADRLARCEELLGETRALTLESCGLSRSHQLYRREVVAVQRDMSSAFNLLSSR